jgi:hypothetical protein
VGLYRFYADHDPTVYFDADSYVDLDPDPDPAVNQIKLTLDKFECSLPEF